MAEGPDGQELVAVHQSGTGIVMYRGDAAGTKWGSSVVPASESLWSGSISSVDSAHAWLLAEPDHGMNSSPATPFATDDAGVHWNAVSSTTEGAASLPFGGSIRFTSLPTGWIVGATISTTNRELYVTRDGGHMWQKQDLSPAP